MWAAATSSASGDGERIWMCACGTRPTAILTPLGSGLEFAKSDLGQHKSQLSTHECLKQTARGLAALFHLVRYRFLD
jgi:hypothetical protein